MTDNSPTPISVNDTARLILATHHSKGGRGNWPLVKYVVDMLVAAGKEVPDVVEDGPETSIYLPPWEVIIDRADIAERYGLYYHPDKGAPVFMGVVDSIALVFAVVRSPITFL